MIAARTRTRRAARHARLARLQPARELAPLVRALDVRREVGSWSFRKARLRQLVRVFVISFVIGPFLLPTLLLAFAVRRNRERGAAKRPARHAPA